MNQDSKNTKQMQLDKTSLLSNQNFGTREISDVSYNNMTGCSHDCKYCYAATQAATKGIRSRHEWKYATYRFDNPSAIKKRDGLVMYPTRHDITPAYKGGAMVGIKYLIEAGNEVLIATKPHLSCVQYLCQYLAKVKDRVRFIFCITSLDDRISAFWEPGAPSPRERVMALQYAFQNGFRTSVLVEPMLDGVSGTMRLYETALPFVTEQIWFGLLQSARERIDLQNPDNQQAYQDLQSLLTEDNIRFLYQQLDGQAKVRWKESIMRVIRKPEPDEFLEYIGGEVNSQGS